MKFKLLVLLMALCLLLIGCDSAEAKKPSNESGTTIPAQGSSDATDNTQTPIPDETVDPYMEITFPEEIQGIELPYDEFPDVDTPPVPVTKPSEPEVEITLPEEETDPPVIPEPEYDRNQLPLDEWE